MPGFRWFSCLIREGQLIRTRVYSEIAALVRDDSVAMVDAFAMNWYGDGEAYVKRRVKRLALASRTCLLRTIKS